MLAVAVVETVGHIAGHFNVLDLVTAHRYMVGVKHQNVSAHENGVHEQSGGDIGVGLQAGVGVFVHRGFVGVGAVENSLAGHAGEKPSEFWYFGNIGLPVERHALRVQACC